MSLEELPELDRLIHEPARLLIMTVLGSVKSADFTFLEHVTGLTKGNLSSHMSKLEAAGLITIEKKFVGKRPNTSAKLTKRGRTALDRHWRQLEELRSAYTAGGSENTRRPGTAQRARRDSNPRPSD